MKDTCIYINEEFSKEILEYLGTYRRKRKISYLGYRSVAVKYRPFY